MYKWQKILKRAILSRQIKMMDQSEIKFCKRCLYSNYHPLGITFDDEDVCSGCKIHEEKDKLDWDFRLEKIKK